MTDRPPLFDEDRPDRLGRAIAIFAVLFLIYIASRCAPACLSWWWPA